MLKFDSLTMVRLCNVLGVFIYLYIWISFVGFYDSGGDLFEFEYLTPFSLSISHLSAMHLGVF